MAQQNNDVYDALRYMAKSIEMDMYGYNPHLRLKSFLFKLGVKSANANIIYNFGFALSKL